MSMIEEKNARVKKNMLEYAKSFNARQSHDKTRGEIYAIIEEPFCKECKSK